MYGTGAVGVRIARGAPRGRGATRSCGGSRARFARLVRRPRYSDYPGATGDADPASPTRLTDLGRGARSPLVDAGDPAPLDGRRAARGRAGDVRAIDGDGDGTARRDIGALERRPPAPPSTARQPARQPGRGAGHAGDERHREPGAAALDPHRRVHERPLRHGRRAVRVPAARRRGACCGAGDAFFAAGPGRGGEPARRSSTSRAGRRRSTRARAPSRACRRCSAASAAATTARSSTAEFRGPTGARRAAFALDPVTRGRARATRPCSPPRVAERRLPRADALDRRDGARGRARRELQRRLRRRHRARPARSRGCRASIAGSGRRPFAGVPCSRGGCGSTGAAARACGSAARARRSGSAAVW